MTCPEQEWNARLFSFPFFYNSILNTVSVYVLPS
jgi:hypothetical protein